MALRPTLLAAALFLTSGAALAQDDAAVRSQPAPQPIEVSDDEATVADAVRILYEAGYKEDAQRVKEVLREMIERRNQFDIEDRGARIDALGRIQATFQRLGWESNAGSLRYIIALARAADEGRTAVDVPRPSSLDLAPGQTLTTELTRIVQQAAEVFPQNGAPQAGKDAARLAEFYLARAAAQERATDVRAADLTYIEGRAPVLALAAEIYRRYEGEVDPGLIQWMDWLAQRSADRVADANAALRPYPEIPFSQDTLYEGVRNAGALWDRAGVPENAARCRALADYYRKRDAGEAPDNSAVGAAEAQEAQQQVQQQVQQEAMDAQDGARSRVQRRIAELTREAEALREQIRALELELQRRR
ncbi:MAG: hypothetical protein AAFP22_05805 [Planctomycetota bacterium]